MDTTLPRLATNTRTHDLGFMLGSPYVPAYETTGDARYADLLRTAARSLDSHWRPAPGGLWSWDAPPGRTRVIVDSLMNLELLYWPAAHGGSSAFAEHATRHAKRLARDAIRADGSTFHVMDYDTRTGRLLRQFTAQGYSDTSTWGRGHGWFLTGMTQTYAATATRCSSTWRGARRRTTRTGCRLTACRTGTSRRRRARQRRGTRARGRWRRTGWRASPGTTPTRRAPRAGGRRRCAGSTGCCGSRTWAAEQPAVLSQVILAGKGDPTPDPVLVPYADYYLLRALETAG